MNKVDAIKTLEEMNEKYHIDQYILVAMLLQDLKRYVDAIITLDEERDEVQQTMQKHMIVLLDTLSKMFADCDEYYRIKR